MSLLSPLSSLKPLLALLALVAVLGSVAWSTLSGSLPPADFTFCNGSEVKSFDPAIVTGSPENRIINALFEGLTRLDPESLEPLPAGAESWDISEDRRTYTFHLRESARWSDGSPVTAEDFHYSLRRFLSPWIAAEYAYQGWYIKNAKQYSLGGSGVNPGDAVEVELNLAEGSLNTLRGELLFGELVKVETAPNGEDRVFTVEVGGEQISFYPMDDQGAADSKPPEGMRWCRQVLLDFREVGVKVLDELTLEITLESPTPFFLDLMAFYPLYPVNRECVEKHGSPDWMKPGKIVGNGPFVVEFRRIRDRIRMLKSPTYWGRDEVRLNVVDALSVDAITTAMNMYMTGEVDWITEAPPAALRVLRKEDPPRNDLNPSTYLSTYFYLLNTRKKPLDDIRVRRALSLALDRKEITSKILASGEKPALGLVPPGIRGYESQPSGQEDADEARRLLAEAGYKEGKGFPRISILYNTHEAHQSLAELIRKQWQRELGIVVKTRNEEWSTYLSSQRQGKYDVCRRGWIGDYADPNTFLDMFVTGGEQNNTGWGKPEYDALIRSASRESDPEERLRILERAERLLMDEMPILPIYFYVSKNLVKPHVRGFYNNVQDFHPIRSIWIDRESGEVNEFMRGRP